MGHACLSATDFHCLHILKFSRMDTGLTRLCQKGTRSLYSLHDCVNVDLNFHYSYEIFSGVRTLDDTILSPLVPFALTP